MRNLKVGLVFALLLVSALLFVPLHSESSDGVSVYVHGEDGNVSLDAGDSVNIRIGVDNPLPAGMADAVVSHVETSLSKLNASYSEDPVYIGGDQPTRAYLVVTLTAESYAATQNGQITIYVGVTDDTMTYTEYPNVVNVQITSTLSAGDSYNRILGIWASPFEDPAYTTVVSLILWIIIGLIISYAVIPAIIFLFIKEDKEGRKEIRKKTWKLFFLLVMLFAATSCAHIYGIGEEATAVIQSIVNIAYLMVGALLVWSVYKALVRFLIHRLDKNPDAVGIDESLIPLLDMIGKILIAVCAFAGILSALGFDLLIILTSAGILGLAISLGAQSSLSQFFSGLTLLITRPFHAGDLIKIDGGDVLRVTKVGLMNSTFDDWSNNSKFTMPNNKVASAIITNITGRSKAYRITVFVGISYDSDTDLAKKLMYEAAMEHPRVVKDGSHDLPSTRLESFEDSYLKMRVSMFVDDFEDNGVIAGQVRDAILKKFKENNITIPFPQMDVHLDK